jgi:hypothetical protein
MLSGTPGMTTPCLTCRQRQRPNALLPSLVLRPSACLARAHNLEGKQVMLPQSLRNRRVTVHDTPRPVPRPPPRPT